MLQLRDDTHLILDDEVRVYPRELSKRWHQRCGQTSPSPLSAPELQYSPAHTDAHAGARMAQAVIQSKCWPKTKYVGWIIGWIKISSNQLNH